MQPIRLAHSVSVSRPDEHISPISASLATGAKRVLVVSSRLFREGLKQLLVGPDVVLSEGCQTVAESLAAVEVDRAPDLVIVVACSAEGIDEALRHIRRARARLVTTKWLLLGDNLSAPRLRAAVESGVDGFLSHDISGEVLKCATELLLLGQSMLPGGLTDLIAHRGDAPASVPPADEPDREHRGGLVPYPRATHPGPPIHLSERERQILDCLVKGSSNKVIARQLEIADATVKVHVKGLLRKMQVANRTQAAIFALNYGNPGNPAVPTDELKVAVPRDVLLAARSPVAMVASPQAAPERL